MITKEQRELTNTIFRNIGYDLFGCIVFLFSSSVYERLGEYTQYGVRIAVKLY
jgi:hypothetical protein